MKWNGKYELGKILSFVAGFKKCIIRLQPGHESCTEDPRRNIELVISSLVTELITNGILILKLALYPQSNLFISWRASILVMLINVSMQHFKVDSAAMKLSNNL